jgi:hypothetical protein
MGICWFPPFETVEQIPETIEASMRKRFRMPMCAEPSDRDLKLVIAVSVDKKPEGEPESEIGVSFNASWPAFTGVATDDMLVPIFTLSKYSQKTLTYRFEIDLSRIRDGWNNIDIYNGSKSKGPFRVTNIDIAIQ